MGLTLREPGEAAGRMDYDAVSMAARRMAARARKKKEIKKAFNRMLDMLNA
jgi:hypothetical protein